MSEQQKRQQERDVEVVVRRSQTKRKSTLLTEDLPAGGLTQEDFKHEGVNLVEDSEEEEEAGK